MKNNFFKFTVDSVLALILMGMLVLPFSTIKFLKVKPAKPITNSSQVLPAEDVRNVIEEENNRIKLEQKIPANLVQRYEDAYETTQSTQPNDTFEEAFQRLNDRTGGVGVQQ